MNSPPITLFLGGIKNADDPMHATLATVVDMLRGEHPDAACARYCLQAASNDDGPAYEGAKKRLPVAVFSGHFTRRSNTGCIAYSSLVVIDLDDVDEPEALRDSLGGDPHCVLAFLSPSGKGVKPVFRVACDDQSQHRHAWASVVAYLRSTYGIDPTSSKSQHDLCRACFVGLDADAVYQPDAAALPLDLTAPIPKLEPDEREAVSGPGTIKPNDRHSYLIAYCARLASIGLPEREILSAAETLIAERFDLSDGRTFSPQEISDAVRSGLRKYRGEDQVQQLVDGGRAAEAILGSDEAEPIKPLVVRTHADRIRDHLHPPPELIPGILPTVGIGAIIGPPGCGKSLIACELARAIASGDAFANSTAMRRGVIYVCSDAPDSTERRFIAMTEAEREGILTVPDAPRLPAGLSEYELALDAHASIGVLILDTWDSSRQHAAGGYAEQDGSTDELMATLRDLAKRRGICIIIIHHSTKADSTQARGTMVFDARCDWMGTVKRENEINLILETTKARDGERGPVGAWRIEAKPHPDAPTERTIPYLRLLTADEKKQAETYDKAAQITERRARINTLATAGKSVREIATTLKISHSTVSRDIAEMKES